MTERVQVVVEAKDAASGVLRGITQQMGALGDATQELTAASINWGNVAQQAFRIGADLAQKAYEAYTELATSVRDLSLISGVGAEEASRLLQVLDDFELQANDVTAATRALTKNGLAPTIETLAQLSDQYLLLNTAEDKNAFILENLGRGGVKWANVLKEGGDALRKLNSEVNENLILTDEQIRLYEVQRLAIDNVKDSIDGYLVQLGQNFGLVVAWVEANQRAYEIQLEAEKAYSEGTGTLITHEKALELAVQEQLKAADSSLKLSGAIAESGESASNSATDYKKLLDMTMKLNDATGTQIRQLAYQDLYKQLADDADGLTEAERASLNEIGIQLGIFDMRAVASAEKVQELNQAFADGRIDVLNYIQALKAIPSEVTTTLSTQTSGTLSGDKQGGSYANGTDGWETVPSGYPNDTFTARLSSGERFKVIPAGEQIPDGATNYFYGNVTFTNNGDGAGFMEQR